MEATLRGKAGEMMAEMMACGHAANAVDGKGNPVCAICYGIHQGATEVVETPSLDGRKARCAYYGSTFERPGARFGCSCYQCAKRYRTEGKRTCKCERDSSTNLAFFEHRPDEKYDQFYCGCHGWD